MAEYKVGYRKPPIHSRFKPGNCANPRGRPKKAPYNEYDILNGVASGLIEYREGTTLKRAHRIEILIMSLGERALKGSVSAAADLLKLRKQSEKLPGIEPIPIYLTKEDMKFG